MFFFFFRHKKAFITRSLTEILFFFDICPGSKGDVQQACRKIKKKDTGCDVLYLLLLICMIFFSEGPGICRTPVCLRGEHGLPRCVRNGTFRTRLPFEGAGYIIIGKDSVGLPDMPAFLPASCICPYARGPAAGSAQCWPGWSALRNSPKAFPEGASAEADRCCPILTGAVNFSAEAGACGSNLY